MCPGRAVPGVQTRNRRHDDEIQRRSFEQYEEAEEVGGSEVKPAALEKWCTL